MAALTLLRIDDRLVHGQVVTTWFRHYDSDLILVCDDDVARDTFTKRVLKAAAPKGVKVTAFSVADTIKFFNAPKFAALKAMVIVKGPEAVEGLIDAGMSVPHVVLGGMGKREGRELLNRTVSASPDEVACFRRLTEKGCEIVYQLVPDDPAVPLARILG